MLKKKKKINQKGKNKQFSDNLIGHSKYVIKQCKYHGSFFFFNFGKEVDK